MTTFVEYQLDDGGTLLVEIDDVSTSDYEMSSSDVDGNQIIKTGKKFVEALQSAKASTMLLFTELRDLPTDEMEITFGLKTTGEAGIFAVGKVGMEANYEVKVKWKRPEQ